MNLTSLLKTHPCFLFADDFRTLCEPLFQLGIDYFGHARVNQHNEFMATSSNPDFFRLYFEQAFHHVDVHVADLILPQRYVLWDSFDKSGKAEELFIFAKELGVAHTFTIIEQSENEKNYYHFAVHAHKDYMKAFYFRHLDLLEQFVSYYKYSLLQNDRLNRAYNIKHPLHADKNNYLLTTDLEPILSASAIKKYLETTQCAQAKSTPLPALPRREMQCAMYLLEGKTAVEIATLLHLSPRTIEVYFDRLRERFGSKNKIQLARHLIEAGFSSSQTLI